MSVTLRKAAAPARRAAAERMVELAAQDPDFVVFESDLGRATFSYLFGEKYPRRYFNMGIAEMATLAAAAGCALGGRTVVVCGYGVFLTMRALEVVRSFICYPNLNVKLLSSHAGLTAAIDGVSHQATEDVAFMGTLPNMKVLAPCDGEAARGAFDSALRAPGPVYTRYLRDPMFDVYPKGEAFPLGGSKLLIRGSDVTIAAYGDMVFQAVQAAEDLSRRGISAEVIDMYSIKPFDAGTLLESVGRTGALLVAENHQRRNGLGTDLATFLLQHRPVPFRNLGLDDRFGETGAYLKVIEKYGLSAAAIAEAAESLARGKK